LGNVGASIGLNVTETGVVLTEVSVITVLSRANERLKSRNVIVVPCQVISVAKNSKAAFPQVKIVINLHLCQYCTAKTLMLY